MLEDVIEKEGEAERDLEKETNPFAGRHDGSVFKLGGGLDQDIFDDLLLWTVQRKASDVTFQPDHKVVADIGGSLVDVTDRPISSSEIETVIRYSYGENGPAEVMGGGDLDYAHEIRIPRIGQVRFRVNVTGGRMKGGTGMQITVRTLPSSPIDISKLGIEQEIIDNFRPEQGLILFTGPTGSGKSTLLASGIRHRVEQPDANEKILEYSAPIEYVYDDVEMPSSIVYQTHAGKDLRPRSAEKGDEGSIFAYCVRNALRRKPTIIIIGEARDRATIEASIEAGLTGHLVFSTMHTIGVAETLRRAVMVFPDSTRRSTALDIMESMRMIVSQLLLPKVGGGVVGCREFMVFSKDIREMFLNTEVEDWPMLTRRLFSEERAVGQTMSKAAQRLLYRNEISKDTFKRVASKKGA